MVRISIGWLEKKQRKLGRWAGIAGRSNNSNTNEGLYGKEEIKSGRKQRKGVLGRSQRHKKQVSIALFHEIFCLGTLNV